MQYMCLIYAPVNRPEMSPEEQQREFAAYGAYTQEARASGKMVAGEPLEMPTSAKTVRVRDGKRTITDGPFAETKEWLAGFYTFNCDTIDEAIEWAAKIPGAKYGSIEVRPVMDLSGIPA
jgi:hypothetical protein